MDIAPSTRVVVTGASRGIGESVARAFAARGATLGLMARSGEELEALAASLATHLHDHERDTMPAWYRKDEAVPAEPLAQRIVAAVEADARAVYYPPVVRLLRIASSRRVWAT